VRAAGTQIAVDDASEFIASISAFDRNNTRLGTFSVPGKSSLALDNSALFLGVLSDTANISRLEFSSSVRDRAIGINTVSVQTAAVAESGNATALILTGLGFAAARKISRKRR
jgi:hypothetical protein